MDNTKKKLVELISSVQYGNGSLIGNNFQKGFIEKIADHLIANGVTFATDNAVCFRKLKKGYQPMGSEAFIEACPTCKNVGSTLCRKCRMEVESGYDPKPEFSMTNGDRFRALNDHELAETIADFVSDMVNVGIIYSDNPNDWLEWFQKPAEVDNA